ncbi:MAG: 16S rRNA processing protein RimM [Williamsia sp.]|nr:16S rRNA processing protein RimM [Williamsia sp.]
MNQYNSIGKFVATHGLEGELLLQHNLGKKTALKGLEAIFLEAGADQMLPYFVTRARAKDGVSVFVKLEGIDTKETARKLMQKEVWLREQDFSQFAASSSSLSLLGYRVINYAEPIGEILEVIEQPHQVLCRIRLGENDAFIPVHAETLKKIDKKKKQVHVELPEGLLDIYR